jgi:hypothetical protein
VWLIRDGLVPLSWFFECHPKPPSDGFKTKLLILEDLAGYVPSGWRKHFGTYRLVSRKTTKTKGPRRLFLTSLVNESYCSLESLKTQFEKVHRWLGPRKHSSDILAFLPIHNEPSSSFASQFIANVCGEMPGHIQCMDWQKFNNSDSLVGYSLVELNDHLICGDSYLSHAVLSRGATLLDPTRHVGALTDIESGAVYTELSPYHGMLIKRSIGKTSFLETALKERNEMSHYYQGYNRAMWSHANLKYPWPQWLMDWGSEQKSPHKARERS